MHERKPLMCSYRDEKSLYQAYLMFINQGGLFIPIKSDKELDFMLGEEVHFTVTLPADPVKYTLTGKVVWITSPHVKGHRSPGIGVALTGEAGLALKQKIEKYIVPLVKAGQSSHWI